MIDNDNTVTGSYRSAVLAAMLAAFALAWGSQSAANPTASGARPELTELAASCQQGDAVSCNDLGVIYLDGYGKPADASAAFGAFQRSCQTGSADGCGNLGALYESGAGVPTNVEEAARLYQIACNQGGALGCSNLGALYARGLSVPRDIDAAERYFAFACKRGSAAGCTNLMELDLPQR